MDDLALTSGVSRPPHGYLLTVIFFATSSSLGLAPARESKGASEVRLRGAFIYAGLLGFRKTVNASWPTDRLSVRWFQPTKCEITSLVSFPQFLVDSFLV
jgi:hypothetical protein